MFSKAMDLGCLDLCPISVPDNQKSETKEFDSSEILTSATKSGKSKSPRGNNGQSTLVALNKFTSQIKKPTHRKNSPLNWFPRKKVDSYLKRKIKMLQEKDGLNLTLDETLGDSNPHYSKVLREKMAAREAANAAMEARKAALVEASWCKILRAARIQSKEAEPLLVNAEKSATEAFEAARALGVIMYDTPNCPRTPSKIETSIVDGGRSTTHTVTASFETAFDVDKEVAAAVKTAFIRLLSCSSFDKDEFKDLLCKISQNPDMDDDSNQELSEILSDYESESGSELETIVQNDARDKLNSMTKLVDMMLERLKCLKEDELSSLATIVATCGLNAALAEAESVKLLHNPDSSLNIPRRMSNIPRRMSCAGTGSKRYSILEQKRMKDSELPSLDKFLVKHMTKLEKEVQEAKNNRTNGSAEGNMKKTDKVEIVPDLGSMFLKHSSKLEKEIEEAKKISGKDFEFARKKPVSDLTSLPDLGSILIKHSSKLEKEVQEMKKEIDLDNKELEGAAPNNRVMSRRKEDVPEVPSLDQLLVKHVSRLEKEVQQAKNKTRDKKLNPSSSVSESEKNTDSADLEKENVEKELKREARNRVMSRLKEEVPEIPSLDQLLVKHVSRLEKEVREAKNGIRDKKVNPSTLVSESEKKITICADLEKENVDKNKEDHESLDKIFVKRVSKLEKEKMEFSLKEEEEMKVKSTSNRNVLMTQQLGGDRSKISASNRREAREKELQEAWGGLSLGNSIKPHVSKLEKDKAAWIKAEEEERKCDVED
ncbi:uncharacterized protein LOC126660094 [Mercurialis annua]|uniref:uncharacterized protein LOC126660094 n=1 Tax=Mercurialis annua TaxID=3986 RepID=UPI00215EB233|nr:uncharacterized protein LOC126660094 [Mercurialis annua]